ncbi:methyl-accepting chemotaxis protein [Bacillus tianshenii]|nr:methyl-accepting chemotaxis protein [Bacillus tianshenii]
MKSLKLKLIMIIASLLFGGLLVVSLVSYFTSTSLLKNSLEIEATKEAVNLTNQMDVFLQQKKATVETLAVAASKNFGNDELQLKLIQQAKGSLSGFETVVYSHDLTGKNVITDTEAVIDVSDRSYIKEIGEGKIAIMDPVFNKATGNLITVVAAPIKINEKPVGFIAAGIPLEEITNFVKDAKFGETGYAGLFGATGRIIYHPKEEMIGTGTIQDFNVAALTEIFQEIQNGKSGTRLYTIEGVEKLAAFASTEDKWGVIYGAPSEELYAPVIKLRNILLTLSLAFLVIGSISMYIVARKITMPIQRLNQAFTVLESGNLSHELTPAGKDEVAQLGYSYNKTINNLQQLVQGVRESTNNVKSSAHSFLEDMTAVNNGAQQVSKTISELSSGVETQLMSVEESTTAMAEMTSVIQKVSENATHVANFSEVGVKHTQEGNEAIKKTMKQMEKISSVVHESANVIKGLGSRSNEISDIVGVITTISEQTNLLALNAAIEAARAGEHGKGFAVVADEVRKLAEQSNQSAGQIVNLIKEIQSDTNQAVEAMNNGVLEVKQGINDVTQADRAFDVILSSSKEMSAEIQEVSAATQQMSASAEQIMASIEELNKIAQKTVEHSREVDTVTDEQLLIIERISKETNELNQTAETLEEAVNRFKM